MSLAPNSVFTELRFSICVFTQMIAGMFLIVMGLKHYITWEINLANVFGVQCIIFGLSFIWLSFRICLGREFLKNKGSFSRKVIDFTDPADACTQGIIGAAFMFIVQGAAIFLFDENALVAEVITEFFLFVAGISFWQAKSYFPS